eukprot:scaffold273_cov242-Pinguiococcus_pyrenoidosus.AAC.24
MGTCASASMHRRCSGRTSISSAGLLSSKAPRSRSTVLRPFNTELIRKQLTLENESASIESVGSTRKGRQSRSAANARHTAWRRFCRGLASARTSISCQSLSTMHNDWAMAQAAPAKLRAGFGLPVASALHRSRCPASVSGPRLQGYRSASVSLELYSAASRYRPAKTAIFLTMARTAVTALSRTRSAFCTSGCAADSTIGALTRARTAKSSAGRCRNASTGKSSTRFSAMLWHVSTSVRQSLLICSLTSWSKRILSSLRESCSSGGAHPECSISFTWRGRSCRSVFFADPGLSYDTRSSAVASFRLETFSSPALLHGLGGGNATVSGATGKVPALAGALFTASTTTRSLGASSGGTTRRSRRRISFAPASRSPPSALGSALSASKRSNADTKVPGVASGASKVPSRAGRRASRTSIVVGRKMAQRTFWLMFLTARSRTAASLLCIFLRSS